MMPDGERMKGDAEKSPSTKAGGSLRETGPLRKWVLSPAGKKISKAKRSKEET